MKRLFSILAIACIMAFGTANATTNAAMTTATTVVLTQEEPEAAAATVLVCNVKIPLQYSHSFVQSLLSSPP